jgi:hypothetical protein
MASHERVAADAAEHLHVVSAADWWRDDRERWEAFRVPWLRHVVTQFACKLPDFWKRCGNLESRVLAEVLDPIAIDKPIYIAGLARSGSTVLLETIAAFSGVASHRYRDFPFVFTPYWWNKYLDATPRRKIDPRPRVHADGLTVSPESPEALEEPLWMAFFPHCHDSAQSQVLDSTTEAADFEAFYRNHLKKVMATRGGNRYACKANYHVLRLEYLLKIFPDARLIVPVRRPRDHVASLMKQDKLFREGETRHPRSLLQMQACGHFEFGLDRRAINFGDTAAVREVERLWSGPDAVRGWARYWSNVYGFLAQRLAVNPVFRAATQVVWFEDLCERSLATVESIAEHCELEANPLICRAQASRLHAPTYYRPNFSKSEEAAIEEETADVVRLLRHAKRKSQFSVRRAA